MVLKQAAIEDSGLLSQIPDSRSYYYEASYVVNLIYSLYIITSRIMFDCFIRV